MEQKEQQFVGDALGVFMRYGIKSVTMDDMARHLGMSKKTIYTMVSDKNDLVKRVLLLQCGIECEAIEEIHSRGLNAIDELMEISKFIRSVLSHIHPSIHYDLEKYHADVFNEIRREHELHIYSCMLRNLKQGVNEGLYREDVNAEVIAKMYIKKIDVVFDAEVFPPTETSFEEVYSTIIKYHLLGVVSAKGRKYLEKKLQATKP